MPRNDWCASGSNTGGSRNEGTRLLERDTRRTILGSGEDRRNYFDNFGSQPACCGNDRPWNRSERNTCF